ncbi:NAD-dependent succinate-semialdehyde dehydrogenase [Sphingobacteriaceae bacterium WQ 2009]|uniref:NAD-dependent succinate-semialdehyde dehydrogenase n=1 Tax=Rhinopithecimicrobium faecis TaxID=2820698 RepID=A0A8T4H6T4_9SPHI|nr:NAD-dependent succinate-semialdehyde dehydrogenase [Sphingobacteriaceae bacterium WQ 2009]
MNKFIRPQTFIDGKYYTAAQSFDLINPATGDVITAVPNLSIAECEQAIQGAHNAGLSWRQRSTYARCELVQKWHLLIQENTEALAELMTLESGKPLADSRAEISYGNSFVSWFAEEGKRAYGQTIPSANPNLRLMTIQQAVGLVAAITPWNFPLAMITRKVAPALVAGCTVILKPASQTPLTAIALAQLAFEAGIPAHVFNVITSTESAAVGELLAKHDLIRKISFTGSTGVGKTLMEQAASTIKKVSMELGGNAPFIVFEDADIDAAVKGAMAGKFRNSGQTCVSINRFYVHETVYSAFAEKLTAAVKALKVGNGLEEGVQIGPLINQKGLKKVRAHVEDALSKGAVLQTGGTSLHGLFFTPTVLTEVSSEAIIASEETFGPVCALFKFATEEEVIALANHTDFGLAAYFFTQDVARSYRVAEALEAGMIGINTGLLSNAAAPFGGVKQSGIGREGSLLGLQEYMEVKYICQGL